MAQDEASGPDVVQLRITAPGKHLIAEGYMRQGMTFWATRANAEIYINKLNIAEPIGGAPAPAEQKPVGPSGTKPAAPAEKKSSAAAKAGRSIDSARSTASAPAAPSSASPAAPASLESNAQLSLNGGGTAAIDE